MLRYLTQRLFASLIVMIGLSVLAFALVRMVPGDTATAMLGIHYDEQDAAALREKYGLDKPVVVQYGIWVMQVVRGDLGRSINGKPVTAEISAALPVTLELASLALGIALLVGVPFGLLAAMNRGKAMDAAASGVSLVGLSVPGFWLGTLLILVFALHLRWLPSGRYVPITQSPILNLRHMILPATALGMAVTAVLMRMTRSAMLEVLSQDYVRTARAKGVDRWRVMARHVARNGIIPVLTVAGLQAGYLLGGSIVIEEVFSLNGIGALVLRALGDRDYPLLQAAILLIGGIFLIVNFTVDLLYTWADPRVSLES